LVPLATPTHTKPTLPGRKQFQAQWGKGKRRGDKQEKKKPSLESANRF